METKRRVERNKIRDKIRQIQKYIQTDEDTIVRLRHQNTNLDYNTKQISKLTSKKKDREVELEILEQRIKDVEQGLLDDEIMKEYIQSNQEVKLKNIELKNKKKIEQAEKEEKNALSVAYHQSGRQSDRKVIYDKRDADRDYNYFVNICNSIPDYILKKLKNMPNNKGYIWRGVYCYGELPAIAGQPTVLFERKNNILFIHEWTDTEYKIWHQEGKDRKTLHSSRPRLFKSTIFCTMFNYLK